MDSAEGGEGADEFRFNAANVHNNDGDHHEILDLDFQGDGDVLLFHKFGSAWHDDTIDPGNTVEYGGTASFNTWTLDSVEDLRELRDSGAIGAELMDLGVGTRITYFDNGGDQVHVDLWGILL